MQRVGIGYDVHRLIEGRKLILGGVEIPHDKGLEGHSDADVLLHAVCDAILGAAGQGDIGEHFPDTDEKYKNISSLNLLSLVKGLVHAQGFTVYNVDSCILAQQPTLKDFKQQMRKNIAQVLDISATAVNIKATTTEKLGFVGNDEGMAAYAVASISKE